MGRMGMRGFLLFMLVAAFGGVQTRAEIAISGNDAKPMLTDGVVKADPDRGPDNIVIMDMKGGTFTVTNVG